MKSITKWSGVLLLGAMQALAQADAQSEAALRAAIEQETVKGDLKGALQSYGKLAASTDRAVAAKALLRMAQCHEKLGDAEARRIYERLVRDYSDQKDTAAAARARLGGASMARAKGDRVVWSGKDVAHFDGKVSPDGRYLSYTDWWITGDLMVHDLATGTDRALTGTGGNEWSKEGNAEASVFSRDGKQLAYGWLAYSPRRAGIRIADMAGTGAARFREVLFDPAIAHMGAHDWSPDQRSIAVEFQRTDRSSHIGIVDVRTGALRVLKPVAYRGTQRLAFSPDGKFLAYDHPASENDRKRDVIVMALEGGQESQAVTGPANDLLMGWSRDGSHLLFSSDRTGDVGLWAVSMTNGRPTEAARLLKPAIGSVWSMGMTASGALHVWKDISTDAIRVAPIDLQAGRLTGPAVVQGYRGSHPEWTRDGRTLVFASQCDTGKCLSMRAAGSDQTRSVVTPFTWFTEPAFSPDGTWVATAARDHNGNSAIYRLDVATGAATKLADGSHTDRVVMSRDGRKLYYHANDRSRRIIERDLASGAERDFHAPGAETRGGRMELSPDGAQGAVVLEDRRSGRTSIILVPVAGGPPRELASAGPPGGFETFGCLNWTPDGRSLLVKKLTPTDNELWLIPLEGQPRKLDIDIKGWEIGVRLSPDGKRIAFGAGDRGEEVWALESYLPSLAKAK